MREIKFRAWDEQNKIMHNEVEFIRSGTEGNDWILFKSDKQKLECENVLNNPYFQQQIKIMQYTGLKDKNGKEIYEGDIVNIRSGEYCQGYWEIDEIFEVAYCLYGFLLKNKDYKENFWIAKEIEVIGNIYENPELLKELK